MRCKIDENLPTDAAELLRSAGHDCDTVYDEALGGAADELLIDRCRAEERVLLTLDLDLADIRAYPPNAYPGIVVFRLVEPDRERVLRLLARTLPLFDRERVSQCLWIVEVDRVRIRCEGDLPAAQD